MGKVIIETQKLKEMLKNVRYAISKERFRPIFTGILLESTKTELSMVTCDGYKLFKSVSEVIEGNKFKTIVPLFTIPKEADYNTIIETRKGFVKFDFGNVKQIYKTIEGDFLDYKPLLERENKFSIRFNSKLLKDTLINTQGIIELYFSTDREAMIIEDINNKKNIKYILPCSKNN